MNQKKTEVIPSVQADAVARAKMLTDPTDPELTNVSLKSEIDALAKLLDQACTQGESNATISTIIDLRGKLRLAQSKVNNEIHKRSDAYSMIERFAQCLVDKCSEFDSEKFLATVKQYLKFGEASDDDILRDLALLRRCLANTDNAADICKLSISITNAVKIATELGLSSGVLLSERDIVELIKFSVGESANHFAAGHDQDEMRIAIDKACQIMGEEVL